MTKGDIQAVFRVNSSGVGDDIIKHESSVTALGSFMNTIITGLSFNSGSSSSLKTGRGVSEIRFEQAQRATAG